MPITICLVQGALRVLTTKKNMSLNFSGESNNAGIYDIPNTDQNLEESQMNYFPYDPEVTDLTLIVEEKKIHVAKIVLMDASPVFRKMFTDNFKEKNATEIPLPGKEYSSFVFFLRCIFPRECVTLSETRIAEILPLAHEYDVKCILRKCETWLMTELEFKNGKIPHHFVSVDDDVEYLMKCLFYGSEYELKELYDKSFQMAVPYKLTRYTENEFYAKLPEKNKRELIQCRLLAIEKEGVINENLRFSTSNSYLMSTVQPGLVHTGSPNPYNIDGQNGVFQCSAKMFI